MPNRASEYFAAIVDPQEFGERFTTRVTEYRAATAVKTLHERLAKAYQYHFGLSPAGMHLTSGITRSGEVGELAEVRLPHLRANSLTVLNLTVSPKVAWDVVATNRDSLSTKQAIFAQALLDYYWLDREVSMYAQQAVAHAIPLTEGFVFSPWDDSIGDVQAVDPETGESVPSGDFVFYNVLPWDVLRDPSKKSWEESRWFAVCLYQNRYELAAKYPDHAEHILDAPTDGETDERKRAFGEVDDIPCWYFFHKKSPVYELRNGREAVILADGTVLRDGELTYEQIPLHRVAPDEQFGTPYGYSQYHEAMGIQEAVDSLSSAILTNQDAFARQMVAVEAGMPFSPEDIGGMKVLYYSNKKPEPLQLTSSPAEAFKFVDVLKSDLQRVQGVNDAVQGQLPGDAKLSGAALALLSSQAIQQNSVLQAAYVRMIRSIGNCILGEWKKRTPMARRIKLVGKQSSFIATEIDVSGKDLDNIKSVLVDIGNPLQQTAAGKMELLQTYLKVPGAVTSPEQIDQLITTGRIEHLTQNTRDELILIAEENEKIAEGEVPPVLIHDDHLRHGREHKATLSSVSARSNPAIVEASIAHLKEHYKVFFGWPDPMFPPPIAPLVPDPMTGLPVPDPSFDPTDPTHDPLYRDRMLILVGQQPPPPMMAPGMAPPGAPPPAEDGELPPPPPGTPGVSNQAKPPGEGGNQTNLPSMPTNPMTGEEYTTPSGQGSVPQ